LRPVARVVRVAVPRRAAATHAAELALVADRLRRAVGAQPAAHAAERPPRGARLALLGAVRVAAPGVALERDAADDALVRAGVRADVARLVLRGVGGRRATALAGETVVRPAARPAGRAVGAARSVRGGRVAVAVRVAAAVGARRRVALGDA